MQDNPVIIISRTDSIGDVILSLPMAGILKKEFQNAKLIFLGRNYTKDIIALSEHIDEFISYDEILNLSANEQLTVFKNLKATHIIHVFPVKHIAQLAKKANIQHRIGTSHRWWHLFTCNTRLKFSRKNSGFHESQLNLQLLSPFKIKTDYSIYELPHFYGFSKIPALESTFQSLLSSEKKNIILHPKSKGSAKEWGLDNFSQLIEDIDKTKYQIFISGTMQEAELLKPLLEKHQHQVIDITGQLSLNQFIAFINQCDALVAASTGPLHIAAALGKRAVGLFSPMRPIHPTRWKPIGTQATYIVYNENCESCKDSKTCMCIQKIKPKDVIALLK